MRIIYITIVSALILSGNILVSSFPVSALASGSIPFASAFGDNIVNYNKATSKVATSGVLSEKGIDQLSKHGFKTIIDLRTKAEGTEAEEKYVKEKGSIKYINIPFNGASITDEQLELFTKHVDESEYPLIIHCGSGNRVGAMWSSYRIKKGIPSDIALEEGFAAGMRKEMLDVIKK